MSGLTTHVLDLVRGRPAEGIVVRLSRQSSDGWAEIAKHETDADGRVREFMGAGAALERGRYRLEFATGEYFRARGERAFHPEVIVVFEVSEPGLHHHVPLLLSPFGYSTYRGS